jgi:uncharacterized protein YdcH (DUF465 family)
MEEQEYQYIPVEEAAEILKMSPRMVNKYGNDGRIVVRKAGRRVLYLRTDVEALAEELAVDLRPPPKEPRTDLVPAGEMLEYIRDRDRRNEELQNQIVAAAAEISRLRTELEHRDKLLEDREGLQQRIAEIEQDRNELMQQLVTEQDARINLIEQLRALEQAPALPWWKRLFGTSENT